MIQNNNGNEERDLGDWLLPLGHEERRYTRQQRQAIHQKGRQIRLLLQSSLCVADTQGQFVHDADADDVTEKTGARAGGGG
jgi:predicted N-acyltransferase